MRYEFTFWRSNWQRLRDEMVTLEVTELAAPVFYEMFNVISSGWNKKFERLQIEEKGKEIIDSEFQLYSVLKIPTK